MKRILLLSVLALVGCDDIGVTIKSDMKDECFSILPANDKRPYMPVKLNKCSGESWLLVEVALNDETSKSFTYRWYKLDKMDSLPPTLVRN